MTLKETRGEIITEYQDEAELNQNRWAKLFGVQAQTFASAAYRGGVQSEVRSPRHPNQPNQRVTSIRNFPKIMEGFAQTKSTYMDTPYHDWAQGIDFSTDFKVEVPSGATLVYKYPKEDPSGDY